MKKFKRIYIDENSSSENPCSKEDQALLDKIKKLTDALNKCQENTSTKELVNCMRNADNAFRKSLSNNEKAKLDFILKPIENLIKELEKDKRDVNANLLQITVNKSAIESLKKQNDLLENGKPVGIKNGEKVIKEQKEDLHKICVNLNDAVEKCEKECKIDKGCGDKVNCGGKGGKGKKIVFEQNKNKGDKDKGKGKDKNPNDNKCENLKKGQKDIRDNYNKRKDVIDKNEKLLKDLKEQKNKNEAQIKALEKANELLNGINQTENKLINTLSNAINENAKSILCPKIQNILKNLKFSFKRIIKNKRKLL